MESITITIADLNNVEHQRGIVALLNMYASEPMQGGAGLDAEVQERLIPGLASQANGRIFLATKGNEVVGIAICFVGFSTFSALPLLNVHDLAVHRDCRGQGIGTKLLRAAEAAATNEGCCKLTLEVQHENTSARRLYQRVGFTSGSPTGGDAAFMSKSLS